MMRKNNWTKSRKRSTGITKNSKKNTVIGFRAILKNKQQIGDNARRKQ